MTYKVIVKNADGSLEWELPFTSFSFTEELNNDRFATFRFEYAVISPIATIYGISVEAIFTASYREIYVYDQNDELIYGGYISEAQFSKGENDAGSVSISSKGFFSLLEKRITSAKQEYTSQDASAIAWDLIDTTQNNGSYGDLGITQGSNPTTKTRDRTFRFTPVAEAIRKLSANEVKEGFDFEITDGKVFNVFYPEKGTKRNNIVLEEGFNIKSYNIMKTFIDTMANQVTVIGQGQGDDTIYEVRDAEDIYKSNFFLLQETLSEKDVTVATTLQDKGDAYLDEFKFPRYIINVVTDYEDPNVPDFDIGDRLKIKIDTYSINRFLRVVRRTVTDDAKVYLSFREL